MSVDVPLLGVLEALSIVSLCLMIMKLGESRADLFLKANTCALNVTQSYGTNPLFF